MNSLNLIKPIHLRLAAMTALIAAIIRCVTTLVPSSLAEHRFSFGLCFVPLVLAGTAGALLYEESTRLKFTLESISGGALPRELETQWQSGAARKRAHPWPHAVAFGAIATAALGLGAYVYFTKTDYQCAALTVMAATAVSFTVSMTSLLARASSLDAGPRLVAEAARTLTSVIGVAGVASVLLTNGNHPALDGVNYPLIFGAALGVVGDQLLQTLLVGVAIVFGNHDGTGSNLRFKRIEGLSVEDQARLNELGIDTLQALATASPATLFFGTQFDFDRICDWQDQALLILYVGKTRARRWRRVFGVHGASVAKGMAARFSADNWSSLSLEVAKQLGFCTVQQAKVALSGLCESPSIKRIEAWRSCVALAPAAPQQ